MKKLLGLGLILILLLLALANKQYNDAVETCVNGGQDRQVCERGLR